MEEAGAQHGVGHVARDAHRGRPALGGPVATRVLTTVGAATVGDASGRDPAGVKTAEAHRGAGYVAFHADWTRPARGGAVAELTVPVAPPAIGGAGGRHTAGVEIAGAHGDERHATSHEYRARVVGQCSVAELAGAVQAPAIGGAPPIAGNDATGVAKAGAHGAEPHPTRHAHGAPVVAPSAAT